MQPCAIASESVDHCLTPTLRHATLLCTEKKNTYTRRIWDIGKCIFPKKKIRITHIIFPNCWIWSLSKWAREAHLSEHQPRFIVQHICVYGLTAWHNYFGFGFFGRPEIDGRRCCCMALVGPKRQRPLQWAKRPMRRKNKIKTRHLDQWMGEMNGNKYRFWFETIK